MRITVFLLLTIVTLDIGCVKSDTKAVVKPPNKESQPSINDPENAGSLPAAQKKVDTLTPLVDAAPDPVKAMKSIAERFGSELNDGEFVWQNANPVLGANGWRNDVCSN
jgi:hypothetical protein